MMRPFVEGLCSLIAGALVACWMNDEYIPLLLQSTPLFLGVLLAGVMAILTIVTAVVHPSEVAALPTDRQNKYVCAYHKFLQNAKLDVRVVFLATVVVIVFFVLAGIPTPLSAEYPGWGEFARRVPVAVHMIGLWWSVSAAWDLLQSVLELQQERFRIR